MEGCYLFHLSGFTLKFWERSLLHLTAPRLLPPISEALRNNAFSHWPGRGDHAERRQR